MNSKTRVAGNFSGALSLFLCLSQVITPAVFADSAINVDGNIDASKLDQTKIQQAAPPCDQICGILMSGDLSKHDNIGARTSSGVGPGNIYSPSDTGTGSSGSASGWTTPTDDQWCANHGFPTDNTILPNATPTPVTTASTCNVPTIGNESCAQANLGIARCMFHGSQLESNCMALAATGDATTFDSIVLLLDIAATVACTTACFVGRGTGMTLGAAAEVACKYVGAVAGVTEFVSTVAQDTSPVAGAIHGILALGGGATALLGAGATDVAGSAGTQAGQVSSGGTGQLVGDGAQSQSGTVKDTESCVAAVFFAVLSGIRTFDLVKFGDTYDSACNNISSLWSSSAAGNGGGGAGTSTNPGQYLFNPQTGGISQGAPGSGGSNGGLGGSTTATTTPSTASTVASCVASGNTGSGCGTAAATDSGALNNSGLGQAVAPLASQLANNGVLQSQGAGAAMHSAMGAGGGNLGGAGGAISQLAQSAQDNAAQLERMAGGIGAGSYSGGGGGGGGGGKGGADNPFAGLFGGGAKDGGARAPSSEQFGKVAHMDIWHTGTTQNIFEIISDKVAKVANRVGSR